MMEEVVVVGLQTDPFTPHVYFDDNNEAALELLELAMVMPKFGEDTDLEIEGAENLTETQKADLKNTIKTVLSVLSVSAANGSDLLGPAMTSERLLDMLNGLTKTTVQVGLSDVENFQNYGDYPESGSSQGSLIPWGRMDVDWGKYGAGDPQQGNGVPPAQVFINYVSFNSGSGGVSDL